MQTRLGFRAQTVGDESRNCDERLVVYEFYDTGEDDVLYGLAIYTYLGAELIKDSYGALVVMVVAVAVRRRHTPRLA